MKPHSSRVWPHLPPRAVCYLVTLTSRPGFCFHPLSEFSKEDMAKSLLHMISNDIGQLACLYAKLHGLDRVYFGGFFIRGHPVTMRTITYSINFFSKVTAANILSLYWCGLSSSWLSHPPSVPRKVSQNGNMVIRTHFIHKGHVQCSGLWHSYSSLGR